MRLHDLFETLLPRRPGHDRRRHHRRAGARAAGARHRHRRHGPLGPSAGRFLPLRQRQVGRQHADSRRPVRLRHVRDPARARPGGACAASSKPRRARPAAPGSISQKVGDLYKSFMDEARIESLGITPLDARAGGDRQHHGRAATCRPRSPAPRASACGCRSRSTSAPTSATPTLYAVQISQAGLGMPDRDYYLRNDEQVRRDSQGLHRPTSPGCSRSPISPIPKAPPRASSRSRRTLAKQQWDRARNRDRNATYNKMTRRGAAGLDAALRLAGVLLAGAAGRRAGPASRTSSSGSRTI